MIGNVSGTDAFDAPDVQRIDVERAPATSTELLNEAADLFYSYGLQDADDVDAWFKKRDGLMDGSLR